MTLATDVEPSLAGLYSSAPAPLPFAPSLHIRAFLLQREPGNLLIYSAPTLRADTFAEVGPVERVYLGHRHEAAFGSDLPEVPLFVHADDSAAVARTRPVRATFSRRHMLDDDFEVIPTPGHSPGASTFLWNNGEHRFLFTGDTIYLRDGEWVAAVLDSSDRDAYLRSLGLIREQDFDVLVPWAAGAGETPYALSDRDNARRRIDAIIERLRSSS